MQELKKVSRTLRENVEYLSRILPVKESFDLIQRDMYIGGRESTFILSTVLQRMSPC